MSYFIPVKFLIVALGYIFVVTGCNSNIETHSVRHNLKFIESFGYSDSVGYITRSRSLSSDLRNYVYVADQGLSSIHQYTLDGDYIKSIGRNGKGPGEFSGNMNVYSKGDSLLVTDFTNLTVSLFHADGELLNTFNLEERHASEFQFFNEFLVAGHSYSFPLGIDYKDEDLLYIYDQDGNIRSSFGEFLSFEEEVPSIMQKNFSVVSNGQLHLVFMFYPVYHIYDQDGTLVKSYQLDQLIPNLSSKKNRNLKATDDFFGSGTADLKGGIGGLFIAGDRVFLPLANDSLLNIEELKIRDSELIHVHSYSYPLNDGSRNVSGYLDFFFIEERNNRIRIDTFR